MEVPTYEFIKAAVEAAEEGDVLFGAAVHDTVYEDIANILFGVRVGDCAADCAPVEDDAEADGLGMEEFDARLAVVVFARVETDDPAGRAAARLKARRLWLGVSKLFYLDTTMGGRVRDCLVRRGARGFDTEGGSLFAVVNMPLLINGTGQLLDREESYQ